MREHPDMAPARLCENLNILTAIYGNCLSELTQADVAYNQVLAQHLDAETKANRATIRAEGTPAYLRKQEARNLVKLVEEMIVSLRHVVRMQEQELRLAR